MLDRPSTAPLDEVTERLRELHAAYRADYRGYYERHADASSPPIRGADPAIVLVPGAAVHVTADITDEAAVTEMMRAAVLAFGGLDLVVNNAGLSISKPLLETTVADWDMQHSVMAMGPSWSVNGAPPGTQWRRWFDTF